MAKHRRVEVPAPDKERYEQAENLAASSPVPAAWRNVRAATAGWADRSLVSDSSFYPKSARTPEARLRHYASQFSLVEVDATYYALLGADLVARWVAFTPDDFRFDVKAHPVLTGHPIDVTRLPRELALACEAAGLGARVYPDKLPPDVRAEIQARFFASLEPLRDAGRLGAVLLQFPPWFGATRANARRLERARESAPGLPLAVEFRNKSWLLPERRERVFSLLTELGASYVCVDEPPSKVGGLEPIARVTHPSLAVVRFHGQNLEGWERKGASVAERFNYLYLPEELASWVPRVRELAENAEEVHAVFNNCVRDYAVLGAKDLTALLAAAPVS